MSSEQTIQLYDGGVVLVLVGGRQLAQAKVGGATLVEGQEGHLGLSAVTHGLWGRIN